MPDAWFDNRLIAKRRAVAVRPGGGFWAEGAGVIVARAAMPGGRSAASKLEGAVPDAHRRIGRTNARQSAKTSRNRHWRRGKRGNKGIGEKRRDGGEGGDIDRRLGRLYIDGAQVAFRLMVFASRRMRILPGDGGEGRCRRGCACGMQVPARRKRGLHHQHAEEHDQ